jgi:glycosyltransferase involved in cell wall biosynthesis
VFGGGSSTFARIFKKWAGKNGHTIVNHMARADLAIIIAHLAEVKDLKRARKNNCCILHRLDEHFENNEAGPHKDKHEKIIELNKYADITVFQSRFVLNNVYPLIKPKEYKIIHNGGDPSLFFPGRIQGSFIGHVTWGIGEKKKMELLYDFIKTHPEENFLLIGRHKNSEFKFNLPNVEYAGKVRPEKLPAYFRKMKMLYYPSENDPCPNTVVESILCGVPVCYNRVGGTVELIKNQESEQKNAINGECGLPLEQADEMLHNLNFYRNNCMQRTDLFFDNVFKSYIAAARSVLDY